MKTCFEERRTLPFSQQEMFHLVTDVASYPLFLPWCLAARVMPEGDNLMVADLVIGYKTFRESYTSRVHLTPHDRIEVTLEKGPFHHLETLWIFVPLASDTCEVFFSLVFEFKSSIAQTLMTRVFEEAAKQMMNAFETRARVLYPGSDKI